MRNWNQNSRVQGADAELESKQQKPRRRTERVADACFKRPKIFLREVRRRGGCGTGIGAI